MSKMKKIIITAVSLVLIVCIAAGGIFTYRWYSLRKNPVSVIPVSTINNEWYGDSSYNGSLYGSVTKGMTQSVYYDSTLTINEVLVKEGDMVEVGTPLINYDTTLLNLQLKLQENEMQTIDLKMEAVRKRIANLKSTKAVAAAGDISGENNVVQMAHKSTGGGFISTLFTPENNSWIIDTVNTGESQSETETKENIPVLSELNDKSVAYKGTGTDQSPFTFRIIVGAVIDDSFITKAVADKCICEFEVVSGEDSDEILYTWRFNGSSVLDAVKDSIKPEEPDEPEEPNEPDGPDYPDYPDYPDEPDYPIIDEPDIPEPGGMTKDELNKAIKDAESELESLGFDKRAAEIEYRKLKNKLTDGTLLSTVKGVVGEIIDEDTAALESRSIMTVTAEDGTYVEGYIGENSLNTISVGQKASIMSYFTGNSYDAVVTEVSDIADESYGSYDQSQSYYKFTALVSDGEELNEADGVDISLIADNTDKNALYIDKAYVREENGIHYVYIAGDDGKLKKQPVRTGRVMDGYAIEIFEGLFNSDYIAFPYGKNVKEGASVVINDDSGM